MLKKTDTIAVRNAHIWTVPASDEATTDSTGAWTIGAGLSQRQYRVYAQFEDLKGRTAPILAKVAQTIDGIVVMLGAEETSFPPPLAFDRILPKAPRGPTIMRGTCCEHP
jgi:hypothetical protein